MSLTVRIIHPDRVLFEGTAELVLVPGKKGTLGILPGHTPMFAELIAVEISVQGEKEELLAIESGILRIHHDELTILVGPH